MDADALFDLVSAAIRDRDGSLRRLAAHLSKDVDLVEIDEALLDKIEASWSK